MGGPRITAEKEAEFRAHYLHSGVASQSARAIGMPESTGRMLARRLAAEPGFAAERRALRASFLEDLVAMRQQVADISLDRLRNGDFSANERGSDYGKLVLEAEKNAQHLARIESGGGAERPSRVEIVISPTAHAAKRLADESDE